MFNQKIKMVNHNHDKKGQVQLGETTAVIVIVIILLVIGIVFWSKVSNSNVSSIQTQSQELSVIEIANIVPELTELKCYESNVNKVKCLDWYKILAMNKSINDKNDRSVFLFYNTYFKNSKITVARIYPVVSNSNITIYDAKLTNNSKTLLISIPVNIKDYVSGETFYGTIIVEGYYNE
jgi:hypothetical protein